MLVADVLIVAPAAAYEVGTSRLHAMRRGFEDLVGTPPSKSRLVLGELHFHALVLNHEGHKHGFSAAMFVGGEASETISPVNQLFNVEFQASILSEEDLFHPEPAACAADRGSGALHASSRRGSRCPCPLKVESAEMTGHVDNLADEIQAGYFARFHRFCREFIGI